MLGGDGDDTLYGGGSDDSLDGGIGNDVLHGGVSDPALDILAGSDTVSGGAGNDTLAGGTEMDMFGGSDLLYGGEGTDHFVCWGSESIMDAESNETFTINGLTISGGEWQFVGKEIDENEEQGYVDTYGYVGQYGEIYTLSAVEIDGQVIPAVGIQFYDRVGEYTGDWIPVWELGIVGWDGDGFMGISLDGGYWGFSSALAIEDLLEVGGVSNATTSNIVPIPIASADPIMYMPPTPSLSDVQPVLIET